ncbi:MAG TPA: signal peptidase I [Patescibacteria group bacterium]|nr:signal peptidase I [Patescibacteria group bacterium]
MPPTKKGLLKKTINFILYLVFVVGLVYFTPKLLSYGLKTQYPMAAITSGSMWPVLKKGDLVFIQGINPKEIMIGDIVVYTNVKNTFTIHRIIELGAETLVTKGDANNTPDAPIRYENIVGRLYKIGDWEARIPKLGLISTFISQYVQKNG